MYIFSLRGLYLPIAPGEIQVKIKNQNQTITLINEGEFNRLKSPGLTDISFSCILPAHKYPFAVFPNNIYREPSEYLRDFETLKTDGQPFFFFITKYTDTGRIWDLSFEMMVSLEEYTFKESASNGHDTVVDIKLKQYRNYKTKTVTFKNSAASVEEERATDTLSDISQDPETACYTVRQGDTLWGIAKRFLGNGILAPVLYAANKDVIEAAAIESWLIDSTNGQSLLAGITLKIIK